MRMNKMFASMTAVAMAATSLAAMSFTTSAADEIGSATIMGSFGTESNWGGETANPNVGVASITGDGQYELTWTLAEATNTGDQGFFVTVVIEPTSVDNFTTDTFENLDVKLDEVWVDGTQLTDYDASAAVDMAYYEKPTGVTRIYLRGDWAGNTTQILTDNMDITTGIKVVFSVAGTSLESGDDVTDPDTPDTPDTPEVPEVPTSDAMAVATFMGMIGGAECWGLEDVAAPSTYAEINGDGTYEVTWDVTGGGTDTVQFLGVQIAPNNGLDNFTTDTFPGLEVSLDEVWIDGVQLTDYVVSDAAINTAYYEGAAGTTRIYLHDDWAGTGVEDLPSATNISQSIKVVFTVTGMEFAAGGMLGDVNEDGTVDSLDAAEILIAAAAMGSGGESGLTDAQMAAADCNGDTEVDALDAAEVLRYAAAVGSGYEGTLEDFLADQAA